MARNCPSCGRANDDDARFCSGCGAEMASAGGPPRKGLSPALLIVIIVLVVAAVVAAAFLVFFMRTDSGTGGDVTTPTPVASAPPTASPTPVESFYLAAVTGPHANAPVDRGARRHRPPDHREGRRPGVSAGLVAGRSAPRLRGGRVEPPQPVGRRPCGGRDREGAVHDAGDRLRGFRRLAQPESAPGGRLHHRAEEPGRGRRARAVRPGHARWRHPAARRRRRRGAPRRLRQRVAGRRQDRLRDVHRPAGRPIRHGDGDREARTGRLAERGGHGARLESG